MKSLRGLQHSCVSVILYLLEMYWVRASVGGPQCTWIIVCVCREDLWVREGEILNPEKLFFEEQGYADQRVDCEGCIIAPGFIDVQINGEHTHAHTCTPTNFLSFQWLTICIMHSRALYPNLNHHKKSGLHVFRPYPAQFNNTLLIPEGNLYRCSRPRAARTRCLTVKMHLLMTGCVLICLQTYRS